MPCLGFPFIAYSAQQDKPTDEKGEKSELDQAQVLAQSDSVLGTIPRDNQVSTMDVQLGLAPEHQEKFHP